MLYRWSQRKNPTDFGDALKFPLARHLRTVGSIAIKFSIDIHALIKINCNNTGDPLTPSSGQDFNLFYNWWAK